MHKQVKRQYRIKSQQVGSDNQEQNKNIYQGDKSQPAPVSCEEDTNDTMLSVLKVTEDMEIISFNQPISCI